MKAKVIKAFRDKETGSVLRPGLIIYVTEERVEELTSTLDPFVEVVVEELKDPEQGEFNGTSDGELELPDFDKMKKEDIVKFAKDVLEIELDISTTKEKMIELLKK